MLGVFYYYLQPGFARTFPLGYDQEDLGRRDCKTGTHFN
jgi:hypothetical protein